MRRCYARLILSCSDGPFIMVAQVHDRRRHVHTQRQKGLHVCRGGRSEENLRVHQGLFFVEPDFYQLIKGGATRATRAGLSRRAVAWCSWPCVKIHGARIRRTRFVSISSASRIACHGMGCCVGEARCALCVCRAHSSHTDGGGSGLGPSVCSSCASICKLGIVPRSILTTCSTQAWAQRVPSSM